MVTHKKISIYLFKDGSFIACGKIVGKEHFGTLSD